MPFTFVMLDSKVCMYVFRFAGLHMIYVLHTSVIFPEHQQCFFTSQGCPAEYLFDWLTNIETKLPYLSDMESFLECRKTVQEAFNGQSIDEIIPEVIQHISYQGVKI